MDSASIVHQRRVSSSILGSTSRHRVLVRHVDIETVNLYSAFVALTLRLMASGGQIVAIIPRSFCNGAYYRLFREFILTRSSIHHIHLFVSRNKAFRHDNVLQENLIILLERDGHQGDVTVTTSTDDSFGDLTANVYPYERIVRPEERSIPLLYPSHFVGQTTVWPKLGTKKPNAIHRNVETERWLYPIGWYCVIRRFSSKEEKRRLVASVVDPNRFSNATMVAFENHLNVFHNQKKGLPEALARGLAAFLNMTAVDDYFRIFSGHTQVNVADLNFIQYPSREALISLGEWSIHCRELTQVLIDEQLERLDT